MIAGQWTSPDGYVIDSFTVTGKPGREGRWLRFTQRTPDFGGGRRLIAQVRTNAELDDELAALGLDLADFTETITGSLN